MNPLYSQLPALLQKLALIERASTDEIVDLQQRQLNALAAYAAANSPYFGQRLKQAGMDGTQGLPIEALSSLPPMTRRDTQAAGNDLFCTHVPRAHMPVVETRTSGSTGEPVVVRRTAMTNLFWLACTMRANIWWNRDLTGVLAVVRADMSEERISQDNWGPPASLLARTGPLHAFSMAIDTATQAALLAEVAPQYLLTYPNNMAALLRQFESGGKGLPSLRQILSLGETVTEELRDDARRILGVEIVDIYSSQEVGTIAVQCPASGQYHVMADNLLVEVLDRHGRPCRTGESGEVVLTDLHNYATPIIRYAIGDYAEVGDACPCGRNLPTLRRILGRSRNMAIYPDGTTRWPRVGFHHYRDIAPIVQYQLVQHSVDAVEVRLVVERPLAPAEEEALSRVIVEALGYPFKLEFVYFAERIPRSKSGKFEEFVCLVPD
jgi:phenylacetate-CoA ligase